jgi:aryl-alcohol dehydrogenase-like predicted oxidoreductase
MNAATSEGTQAYMNARAGEGVSREHFRQAGDLWLSSVGLGTYLGHHDEATDDLYRRAVVRAAQNGCNVIDTAINYRCQRSERSVGEAIRELAGRGIGRDQLVISTKGGFIPFDGEPAPDPQKYLESVFISNGILDSADVVGGAHAMTPRYLEHQLDRSLSNLVLETIDVYYLHNPETQLSEVPRDQFQKRLRAAFEFLEKAADQGKIRFYGTATWNAYREPPQAQDYLSLQEVVGLAKEVGGEKHRFRFIQLPFNLAMLQALVEHNQPVGENTFSTLLAADELGVQVIASASLFHGKLTRGLPEWLGKLMKGFTTDAQRSLQFARSAPGLTTALVGMKKLEHVAENLAVTQVPPAPVDDFLKLFEVDER